MAGLKKIHLSLALFLFFMITGCNSASFTYCETNPCKPILFALSNILNSFESLDPLQYEIVGIDYCRNWTFIICDVYDNIEVFNLNQRHLKGVISPFFANFTFLEHLDLDGNFFTGEVPESLLFLNMLIELDISDNNLTGRLPNFNKRVEVKAYGNPFLEIPAEKGAPEKGAPVVESGRSHSRSLSVKVVVLIIFVIVICLVVAFFLYRHYVNKRLSDVVVQREFELQTIRTTNSFSIEVLRQATNNFDDQKVVGTGGCGKVYKGDLPDGSEIAIKKIDFHAMQTRGLNEFEVEVDVLTRVRHRHLVTLLGHCSTEDGRFLVYEYMPQGTLKDHLFDFNRYGYPPLTWKQRVTIALDVSRGMEYLHGLTQQSFIHRDLKPSNVLLDDEMRAKVSDFGLVKNVPQGQFSAETSRVAGTFGYIAPDYVASLRVTTKVDVYAFGIILMELITGRKSIDSSLGEDQYNLVIWFRQVMHDQGNIHSQIDRALNLDEETMESIAKVAELAVHCTIRERADRPNMSYAVSVLSPLVEQWRPTATPDQDEDDQETEGIDLGMTLPQILERWQEQEGTETGAGTSTMYYDLDD